MSGFTSVPQPAFGSLGFVMPAEGDILTGRIADINAAFGGGLNPALESSQGQLASSDAAIIGDANAQMVALFNGVDPAYATGRQQDGIARIYFLTRNPATPTAVPCACGGLVGVIIPAGALAQATDGNLYQCVNGGTIPSGGTITLGFTCLKMGPIACPTGSFSKPYQAVFGWDTIANPTDGILGNAVESRAAFEARRQATVEANSIGSLPSVIGAVAKVAGVLDFYGYNNATNAAVTVGGQSIAANSIYICVAGGAQADVAQAILSKKSPGCSYTGNTTVTAYDSNPLYSAPIPYSVTFEVPTSLPILFAVSVANSNLAPYNAAALIQAAIISAFAGGDDGLRARIGTTIYASRFYAPVAALGSWAQIISILVGTTAALLNDVTPNINQVPVVSIGDITVTLV